MRTFVYWIVMLTALIGQLSLPVTYIYNRGFPTAFSFDACALGCWMAILLIPAYLVDRSHLGPPPHDVT